MIYRATKFGADGLTPFRSLLAAKLINGPASLLLHLDGSLTDSAPDAVAVTGGSGMSYVTGKFGQAVQFSGDYEQGIFIPSGAAVIGAGSWTLEMWIKPSGTSRRALLAFENDCRLGIDLTDVVRLWAGSGSGWNVLQSDGGGDSSGIGTVALTVGSWNHIAYQYDANSSRYTSFVNGVKDIDKVRAGGAFLQTSEALRFGRWGGDSVAPCDDAIDEIRISQFVRYTENFTPAAAPFSS